MDIVFEVTGHPSAARVVTDVVRVWGTVSIVAIHAEPMRVNRYQMFARCLSMHGSRLYARADWEEAIRLADPGRYPGAAGQSAYPVERAGAGDSAGAG